MTPAELTRWNAAEELEHDRRVERRLLVKEVLIVAFIAALVVVRVVFVG